MAKDWFFMFIISLAIIIPIEFISEIQSEADDNVKSVTTCCSPTCSCNMTNVVSNVSTNK